MCKSLDYNIWMNEIRAVIAECSGNLTERTINFKVVFERSFTEEEEG